MWNDDKAMTEASNLTKDNWVLFHLDEKLRTDEDLFWDHGYGLGRFVPGVAGTTDLTTAGTMVTVSPFRASQLDNVFLEQKEDKKLMVSCTELLACGLEVRVTKKAGKYSAKYYSDTDKENGIVVQLKEITRSLIMKRLDKWSEPAIKKKKEKKNKKNSSNKKRKKNGGDGNGDGGEGEDDQNNGFDMEGGMVAHTNDDSGDGMSKFKCEECQATSFQSNFVNLPSSHHLSSCTFYKETIPSKKSKTR